MPEHQTLECIMGLTLGKGLEHMYARADTSDITTHEVLPPLV